MHYSQDSQNINNILHLIQYFFFYMVEESPKGELYNFKSMYSCVYICTIKYMPPSQKSSSLYNWTPMKINTVPSI